MHVLVQWEEAGVHVEIPSMDRENIQMPHSKAPAAIWTSYSQAVRQQRLTTTPPCSQYGEDLNFKSVSVLFLILLLNRHLFYQKGSSDVLQHI